MITNDKIVNGLLYKDVMEACLDLQAECVYDPKTDDYTLEFDDDSVVLAFDDNLFDALSNPENVQVAKELASIIGGNWQAVSAGSMLHDPYLVIELPE